MAGNPKFGSLKATTYKRYETQKARKKRGSKKKK